MLYPEKYAKVVPPARQPMKTYVHAGRKPSVEELTAALKGLKLVKTVNGKTWEAHFNDTVHKQEYYRKPDYDAFNELEVKDLHGNIIRKGKVFDANESGAVLKFDDLFYKMKVGDSLDDVLAPAKDKDGQIIDKDREPLKEYKRGDWKGSPPPAKAQTTDDKKAGEAQTGGK